MKVLKPGCHRTDVHHPSPAFTIKRMRTYTRAQTHIKLTPQCGTARRAQGSLDSVTQRRKVIISNAPLRDGRAPLRAGRDRFTNSDGALSRRSAHAPLEIQTV
jgi:hypothetical protein